MSSKIEEKVTTFAKKIISKTAPTVKKEAKKVASTAANNACQTIFNTLKIGTALAFTLCSLKPVVSVAPGKKLDIPYGFFIVYNETTNNYYKEV